MPTADGRIDPGGRTWRELSGADSLSGGAWWQANQARFPNSQSVDTLDPDFKAKVVPFLAALKAAGATVAIASTLRHPIRAYLMHYSWKIAKGIVTPAAVPAQRTAMSMARPRMCCEVNDGWTRIAIRLTMSCAAALDWARSPWSQTMSQRGWAGTAAGVTMPLAIFQL